MKDTRINGYTIETLLKMVEATKTQSAWKTGVKEYALELVEELEYSYDETINDPMQLKKVLLNGANDWSHYSWSGCALCYDYDIAERLCNPTELKRTNYGERQPNKREEWLDTQARALYQAYLLVKRLAFSEVSR